MNAELLAFIGSGAFIALITAVVQGVFARRKVVAESDKTTAEATNVAVQNALAAVGPLQAVVETLTVRLAASEKQIDTMAEKGVAMAVKLDSAEEQVGILTRREREHLMWQAEMTVWIEVVAERLRAAGQPVPDFPKPPNPRAERTRRADRKGDGT